MWTYWALIGRKQLLAVFFKLLITNNLKTNSPMKSNHKYSIVATTIGAIFASPAFALTPFSDNFNGASIDKTRWILRAFRAAKFTHDAGRVNFTTKAQATNDDYAILELRNNRPGFNENWQIILDVQNSAGKGDKVGTGITIYNAADPDDNVNLEFYGLGAKGGFNFIGITDDVDNQSLDVRANPRVTKGSLRVSFSKTTKLYTFWYDTTGSADGFQWRKLCTFSPTGTGGTRRGNWKLNAGSGSFGIRIFGYAELQTVANGRVNMDNFALKASN